MDASINCEHSVFELISKLAVLLLQDERAQTEPTDAYAFVPAPAAVAKRRSEIYESLLRLRPYQICPRLDRFPQCRKLLDEQRIYFEDQLITDIQYCLVKVSKPPDLQKQLSQYLRSHEADRNYRCRLLLPLPLRLEANPFPRRIHNSIYASPVIFKSIEDLRSQLRPVQFCRSTDIALSDIEELKKPFKDVMKNNLLLPTLGDSMARMKEFIGSIQPMKTKFPMPPKPKEKQQKTDAKAKEKIGPFPDKYFISDQSKSNELKWHQDRTIELSFIELSDFIDHLKKASAGLQSETFLETPDGHFEMRANATIETVLPEVLADYARPFLESGGAYQRLLACTQWKSYSKIERPMNRTMRQAIITFLANSRLFLFSQPADNLSQLLHSAGPTMQLLVQLDQMFQAERRLDISQGTSGACLLSVIWSAIDACVNIQYLQFLMYLLRSLCATYCGQLQNWLYHGALDEHFNEIFVGTQRDMEEKSKEYFDKAHFVHPNMVPGFLAGCEPAIIQCGKYSRLLKSYNPQHMLFTAKHPDLVICLSQNQLTEMQQKLELHYKQLLHHIHPFRMQHVIEERAANRWRFGNRMWSCTQERIADWKENQRELLIKANEGKRRRYEELNNQRREQEEIRLEHRRMEIACELAFQQKREQQDEKNLSRQKRIYEEQIAALQKIVQPKEINVVVSNSPDDSTNSSRSFVSCCEELSPKEEEATKIEETLTEESDSTSNLKHKSEADEKQTDQQNSNVVEVDIAETPEKQNSNDANDEMERNRERNMCSKQFLDCQTHVELQKTTTTNALTELECNRLHVLNCTDMQPPDVNMNLEITDLSDMQRNRQRMQHHQHFGSLNNITKFHSKSDKSDSNKKLQLSIDLQLPLEPHKLFVEPALDTATPMSTTSDVDVETCIPNETVDAANNNINGHTNCDSEEEPLIKTPKKLNNSPALQLRKPDLSAPTFQLQKIDSANCATSNHRQLPRDHNSFLIKRYVQQSIMVPLKTHLSLLRNEVLRIFDDLDIYEHFCQLRNYFFLLDGEFGTVLIGGILERIESGMDPRALRKKGTLDAILNNALGHKVAEGSDAAAFFVENLNLNCANAPESFDLMDINALSIFTLHSKIDWPLNLVISVETMAKYTQIFSHLLKLRHVSFMLERAYQHFQQLGKLHGKALQVAPQYRHLQMVRHKLSHFVITLQNHLETNALQGTWETFNEKLCHVDSVEGLYQRHAEYLKNIAFISLLNRRSVKFRETIDSILVIVLRFCKVLQSKPFVLDQNQEFIHPRYKRLVFEETEFQKFLHYVIYLGDKVNASGYQEKIVELIRIINFNKYYDVKSATN
ncbi:uncharacterized protein LOC117788304 [Drosophila innubila]|uniref:uncharacterized protein LOC117788304 n=1 Tax=Drosophila innubila TaxID=198719 RepID=UPI00148E8C4F|nr:uncharacterized protein LOC117788304 [Drosophila innubila]